MTTAVILPEAVGGVVRRTVRDVAVAAVTVPEAPLLNVTELFAAVVSNPNPVMVSDAARADTSVVVLVTTGVTEATWTGVPLDTPLDVTTAVSTPALGLLLSETVSEFAFAEVTVPTAPLLNVTRF